MNKHIISAKARVIDALRMLNDLSGKVMTLFALDDEGRVCGTLTDGDIRRGIIAGAGPQSTVEEVMYRNFKSLDSRSIDIKLLRYFRERGIKLIPRLDEHGHLIEIIDITQTPTRLPLSAILMAGGKGERLRPLTFDTPKPLLKIGDKAIIDYNIDAIRRAGIKQIRVAVNYMAEKIEAHFAADPLVECVREPAALGTIGAAALMKHEPDGNTLVMNADLLTSLSLEDMYLHHIESGADITIAAIPYNVAVPYAILSTDAKGNVTALEEKPSFSYYANAGIYIISNKLLRELKPGVRTDATDLIENAIAGGRSVGYFPISGVWIDVGTPTDFAHACELMRKHKLLGDR